MSTVNTSWIRYPLLPTILGLCLLSIVDSASSQPFGKGGRGGDPTKKADMEVFHYLLDHRSDIKRTVKKLPDGVETVTESTKADVAAKIQQHAESMHARVKRGQGIHLRDPLFAELFKNYDKITMKIEKLEQGVRVRETSSDPQVARLIQAHAEVVSKFVANGHDEVRKNHRVPPREAP